METTRRVEPFHIRPRLNVLSKIGSGGMDG